MSFLLTCALLLSAGLLCAGACMASASQPAGSLLGSFCGYKMPNALYAGSSDGHVYAADFYTAYQLERINGTVQHAFGLSFAQGLAMLDDGLLYVTALSPPWVVAAFDLDGKMVRSFPISINGSRQGGQVLPHPAGGLLVHVVGASGVDDSDSGDYLVHYGTDGSLLSAFSFAPDQISFTAMDVNKQGDVYVAAGDSIYVMHSDGSFSLFGQSGQFPSINGLALDAAGNVYWSTRYPGLPGTNGALHVIDSQAQQSLLNVTLKDPAQLSLSADGSIYAIDPVSNCIWRLQGLLTGGRDEAEVLTSAD